MKLEQIKNALASAKLGYSKWELDTIVWYDRLSNPKSLTSFFSRIEELQNENSAAGQQELTYLLELLNDMDMSDVTELLSGSHVNARDAFIENLSKVSAIELLTTGRLSTETLTTSCKLSPNDFILCSKRTQDLLTAIQGLVIKGETLSKDVAGA